MNTKKLSIIFACRWNAEMEKTWSGTAYAIYKEFQKRFHVERFDIKDTRKVKLFKIFRKLHLVKGDPSLLSVIQTYNHKFEKIGEKGQIIFQFDETPWNTNTINYIYQDLSVAYIRYMKQNEPVAYSYSGFSGIKDIELQKREELQQKYYTHCKGIFTMGQWLADFMVSNCGIPKDKIHVVGAGINVLIAAPDYSKKSGNKILFVGKDFERKGGKLVIEAFKILREKYRKDAELYIAGPEDKMSCMDEDGIIFLGNLSKEKVAEYFEICDIFCMPSYFEAFGIVFCEALASGLPCIARRKYAMKEIIEDGEDGYLIDDDDAQILAQKMNMLLLDNKITQNVRKKRETYIQKYSWERIAGEMEKVILNNY